MFLVVAHVVSAHVASQPLTYANGFPSDATQDQPFICDYRSLAWEFAKKVQPDHGELLWSTWRFARVCMPGAAGGRGKESFTTRRCIRAKEEVRTL
jgi:hypothetical protein